MNWNNIFLMLNLVPLVNDIVDSVLADDIIRGQVGHIDE